MGAYIVRRVIAMILMLIAMSPELIYANSDRGFALCSMRSSCA